VKKSLSNVIITSSKKNKEIIAKGYDIKIINKIDLYRNYIKRLENKIDKLNKEKEQIKKSLQQQYNDELNKTKKEYKKILDQNIEMAYEDGIKKGIEKGKIEKEEELKELFINAQNLINEITSKRDKLLSSASEDVLKLSIAIARKIMKVEPHINKKVVKQVTISALEKIIDKSKIILHLHPQSISTIENSMNEILIKFKDLPKIEIVEDKLVGPGGCIIETNSGFVDARLETQLQKIQDKIFLELKKEV